MSKSLHTVVRLSTLPQSLQQAALAAVKAQESAYAPYSGFGVGACLLHKDGCLTTGCNYENCTLQACCAERCAIVRANVEGRRTAEAVAVYGRSLRHATVPTSAASSTLCPPCGLCRQLLVEVADLSKNYEEFQVVLVAQDQQHASVVRLADLLPLKFGPADVGVDLHALALADERKS